MGNWPKIAFVAVILSIYAVNAIYGAQMALIFIAFCVSVPIAYWWIADVLLEKKISKVVEETDAAYLDLICSAAQALSSGRTDGYFVLNVWKLKRSEGKQRVFLSKTDNGFWWENQDLIFSFNRDYDIEISFEPFKKTAVARDYFLIPVPTVKRGKKVINRYSQDWIYEQSPELKTYFEMHYGRRAKKAFRRLFGGETRTGTKPSWIQNAEFHRCPECKRKMPLVAQIEGYDFGSVDRLHYIFGCSVHEGVTKQSNQFT